MPDFVPILSTFNGGELSPLLDGRTDQEKYFSGCKTLENFIPTVQGPARRRAGTRYVGAAKTAGERAWLGTFEFSTAQSYVLEFGNLYLRFWTNRAQLVDGTPYEVVSPWATADLVNGDGAFSLRFAQSGDVLWIVHSGGAFPPYKLSRLGATDWTLEPAELKNGPFADVDPDETTTVYASATTGTGITLTASSSIFTAADVGNLFYVETENAADLEPWEPDTTTPSNKIRRYEGNVYKATNVGSSNNSGTVPPTHLQGTYRDGRNAVAWQYLHSQRGTVRITAQSGTTATADVVTDPLPEEVVGSGNTTNRWAKQSINDDAGWPTDVTFFRSRLFYQRETQVFGTVVGAYDDFNKYEGADITDDTAISLTLTADKLDRLRWMLPVGKVLLNGAPRLELAVSAQTQNAVLSADNVASEPQTEYGSNLVQPIKVDDAVLFLQRGGRRLREMRFSYEIERFRADDVTVLADHVLRGVIEMDYQAEPYPTVWCVCEDGTLAALTYNRERGVVAWARHSLGGDAAVESIAVIPSPDGTQDDLWLIVRRTINGATVRYVEYLESPSLYESGVADSFFVDCGITYSGAAVTTITGLDHLEGETVQVLADGSAHPDRTVSSGQITLNRAAEKVQIGFGFVSRLQTMRLDIPAADGTTQSRPKSTGEVSIRVIETIGGKIGPSFDRMDRLRGTNVQAPVGTAPALVTGDIDHIMPVQTDTNGYICIEQDQPLPFTLAALMPRMTVGEA